MTNKKVKLNNDSNHDIYVDEINTIEYSYGNRYIEKELIFYVRAPQYIFNSNYYGDEYYEVDDSNCKATFTIICNCSDVISMISKYNILIYRYDTKDAFTTKASDLYKALLTWNELGNHGPISIEDIFIYFDNKSKGSSNDLRIITYDHVVKPSFSERAKPDIKSQESDIDNLRDLSSINIMEKLKESALHDVEKDMFYEMQGSTIYDSCNNFLEGIPDLPKEKLDEYNRLENFETKPIEI